MKKAILPLVAIMLVCSACGTRIAQNDALATTTVTQAESYDYKTSSGQLWGEEGNWSTTPDGYPIW